MRFQFKPLSTAVLTLCALGHGSTHAAEPAPEAVRLQPVQIDGKQSKASRLQARQSTASRLGLSGLELPASSDSVLIDQQALRGVTGTADLVQRTVGMSFQGSPGSGSTFQSRGFSGNDSIVQAEDGVRVPTTSGTQSMPQDGFGYERVEVLRGPASVLFGDGAVGGVINLLRKQPRAEFAANAEAGLGSFGAWRVGLGLNQPLSAQLALRLDLLDKGGEGFVARGDWRQRKLMSTLRWQVSPDFHLDLILDLHRDRNSAYFGTPLREGRIDARLREQNYNVEDAFWRVQQDRARLRGAWTLAADWRLEGEVYRFEIDRQWRNLEEYELAKDGQAVDRVGYLGIAHRLRQAGGHLELKGRSQFMNRELGLVLGLQGQGLNFTHINDGYEYDTPSRVSLLDPQPGRYLQAGPLVPRQASQTRQYSAYAEAALSLAKDWTLHAGLRADRMQVARQALLPSRPDWSAKYQPTTWRLGLLHAIDAGQSVYLNTGLATDPISNIATISKGNADWKLSSGRQWELGYKRAGKQWDATAALYQIKKEGLLTTVKNPGQEAYTVQGGSLLSSGVELTAQLRLPAGFALDGNISWNRTRYDKVVQSGRDLSGNQAPYAAKQMANLGLTWAHSDLDAGVLLRGVGPRFTSINNSMRLPGYAQLDAYLNLQLNPQVSLGLAGRNLADTVYATSSYSSTQVMLGEPRNWQLTGRLNF
ncbi:TonB-dependent siderophore receptor [Paucibacter sp. KBW04]|uniref:TonB-dependent receptor n=1 Tax=Paucibacter sp. KBW04 TaxID=2153361 RepID=UPI000F58E75A|nr:TonB-dependent receptor [Paucibacter sp. KBW04]